MIIQRQIRNRIICFSGYLKELYMGIFIMYEYKGLNLPKERLKKNKAVINQKRISFFLLRVRIKK